MQWLTICCWLFLFGSNVIRCNKRYYITEKCGEILGPVHGAYFLFDSKATMRRGKVKIPDNLKGILFECLIVVRGVPSTGKTRYMAIHWRDFHIRHQNLDGFHSSPEACGNAYVTIYKGIDQSLNQMSSGNWTMCGKSAIRPDIEYEGEYVTLYFYIDYTQPIRKSTLPPSPAAALENRTSASMGTLLYPEVYFKLDITSFDYDLCVLERTLDCTTTTIGKTMRCKDSKRCIDESLRCDYFSSLNCASELFPLDKSDRSRDPPGNCGQFARTTTTIRPSPPIKINWKIIAAGGGSFILLFNILWCFCRPGYCIWRCGRCRNGRCCIWHRARQNKLRPKADTQTERIPRNAILTRFQNSRFLQVDGYSDDGYSGTSTRASSPISVHGFSSRNLTARGTSPKPGNRTSPVPPLTPNRSSVKTGVADHVDDKENTKSSNHVTEAQDKERENKKSKSVSCPCFPDPKKPRKQAWTTKKIAVVPVEIVTVSEVN